MIPKTLCLAFLLLALAASCSGTHCLGSQYECRSGQCVWLRYRCDGIQHCFDGSDENYWAGCSTSSTTTSSRNCLSTQFECTNGQCLSRSFECDGDRDCRDGSDETHCGDCYTDEFECDSGQCVSDVSVCDGVETCIDGSDEDGCYDIAEAVGLIVGLSIFFCVLFCIIIPITVGVLIYCCVACPLKGKFSDTDRPVFKTVVANTPDPPSTTATVVTEGNLQAVDPPPYAQPPGDDFETGQKPGCPVGFSYEEPGRQAAV